MHGCMARDVVAAGVLPIKVVICFYSAFTFLLVRTHVHVMWNSTFYSHALLSLMFYICNALSFPD